MTTETLRAIVRDAAILDGRWHIEGTHIPIAEVCHQFRACGAAMSDAYLHPSLTASETQAALAFDFPAIRPTATSVLLAVLVINCECGEDINQTLSGWPELDIACVCGRVWDVSLQVLLNRRTLWQELNALSPAVRSVKSPNGYANGYAG